MSRRTTADPLSRRTPHPAEQTMPTDAPKILAPHHAPHDTPTDAPPTEQTDEQTAVSIPSAHSDWYTDTLRTIVSRALNADKPDIKGALAALQLLAETECEPWQDDDIARILRDARRRVIDGKS